MALAATAIALAAAIVAIGRANATPAPARMLTARTFAGIPTVGALFRSASSNRHFCTASVVRSRRGNVLITAAHCIHGGAAGYVFVPGDHDGIAPYGRWTVTAAYVDPGWLVRQDPRRDFAFLTVAPRVIDGRLQQLQQVTGANRLHLAALRPGAGVTVPAYPAGTNNDPITCTAPVYYTLEYPAFNCTPYPGGTSGAPLLVHTSRGIAVGGVIGGLHQGGCYPFTSYSAPLGLTARRVYAAAAAGAPGTRVPVAGNDGC